MEARGGLNSTMAMEAERLADYQWAVPIAQTDRQIDSQELVQQSQEQSQMDLLNRKGEIDQLLLEADTMGQMNLLIEKGKIDAALDKQQNDHAIDLLDQKGKIDIALQDAKIAGDLASEQLLLDQKAKIDEELQKLIGGQNFELQSARYGYEMGLLDKRGDIDMKLQDADAETRKELLAQQAEIDKELLLKRQEQERYIVNRNAQITSELQKQKAALDKQILRADGEVKAKLIQRQGAIDLEIVQENYKTSLSLQAEKAALDEHILRVQQSGQLEMEEKLLAQRAVIEESLQKLVGSQALEQQGLRGEQAKEVANIEGNYRVLMQSSQSASVFFSNVSASISEILANKDIPAGEKDNLVKQQVTLLKNGLAVIGGISDLDLNDLLQYDNSGSATNGFYGSFSGGNYTGEGGSGAGGNSGSTGTGYSYTEGAVTIDQYDPNPPGSGREDTPEDTAIYEANNTRYWELVESGEIEDAGNGNNDRATIAQALYEYDSRDTGDGGGEYNADNNYGFTIDEEAGDAVAQVIVEWKNTKTGETFSAPNPSYKPPNGDWEKVNG
jgi:hypothetical protein